MTYPALTDIDTLQALLGKAGITPSRSQGQNFLICAEPVEATLLALEDGPRVCTELGAGVGTLTQALAAGGYRVRAIERDRELTPLLQKVLSPAQRRNLELIEGDLREVEWSHEEPYQLVGNIPYNLSGLIIRRLTQLTPAPTQAVLLVQKEVGERLTAAPPDMHLITVAVHLWGTAETLLTLPPDCFWPAPKVSSQLVVLTPHKKMLSIEERERILSLAKQCFQGRRKQLAGTLRRITGKSAEETQGLLGKLSISPTARPQELTVDQWIRLTNQMSFFSR